MGVYTLWVVEPVRVDDGVDAAPSYVTRVKVLDR